MVQRFIIYFLVASCCITSCQTHDDITIHRGFYFWKSRFALDSAEANALKQLKTEQLYIKFFDVGWDALRKTAEPMAKIDFVQPIPDAVEVVPVVFITNETLVEASPNEIATLALNIPKLISSIISNNKLSDPTTIQIDCDWTAATKEKYFLLLKQLRKTNLFQNKTLSVTIRLHQVKYINESGIPPADRGLLMCYNMGNLRHAETNNSIIETATLKQYIGQAKKYPLPLDIGLPLFQWWVWFQDNEYKGLIHGDQLTLPVDPAKKWRCKSDTTINGYTFKAGDWLRFEDSPVETIKETISALQQQLNTQNLHVILYHLDAKTLSSYEMADIESMYTGFSH